MLPYPNDAPSQDTNKSQRAEDEFNIRTDIGVMEPKDDVEGRESYSGGKGGDRAATSLLRQRKTKGGNGKRREACGEPQSDAKRQNGKDAEYGGKAAHKRE